MQKKENIKTGARKKRSTKKKNTLFLKNILKTILNKIKYTRDIDKSPHCQI